MEQTDYWYYEASEANTTAFTHGLFAEAYQSLSTALYCAFDLQSARRLGKIEGRAQEQLAKLEEHFSPTLWPLEPDEVSHYRALVELAATYRELVKNASQGDAHVVTRSLLDGHRFEDTTTIDAHSRMLLSFYAIDGILVEPGTWDIKYKVAQEHQNVLASEPVVIRFSECDSGMAGQ